MIGPDWRYLYANPETARQARVERETLIGRTMMECFPGIEQTPMFGLLEQSMRERVVNRMENDFQYPDGARAYFSLRMIPVPDGVCVLSLDVTERRNELAALVQGSDDAIVGLRSSGVITSWNRGAADMFGYTAQEIVGRPIAMLYPIGSEDAEAARHARLLAGERLEAYDATRRRRDGGLVEVSVRTSPICDASGAIVGLSSIKRDIGPAKRLERELVEARQRVEAANRELEAFSYSVAHDLRAPLRAIDGFSLALVEDAGGQLDEASRAHLAHVRSGAQRMGRLIDDLLRLARVTRQDLVRSEIDLSSMARGIGRRLASESPTRKVELSVADGLFALADAPLTAIVLENLLGNAWKFTAGREVAHVAVGASDGSFFVRDDGAGFDPRFAGKLFAPFERLHNSRDFPGTGIGLAIVSRIVLRHGGLINASGAVDGGAEFRFNFGGGR